MNETYTIGWIIWILMFGAIEGAALLDKDKGDTLTEHVREWFALRDKPTGWKLRRGALALFLVWLPVHFFA